MNIPIVAAHMATLMILFFSSAETFILAQSPRELPPLPLWLGDRRDLLPPLTTNEVSKMEQAWPRLQVSDVPGNEPPEYWEALQTVVELGENASLALVWLYAKDSSRLNPMAAHRRLLLRVLSNDTISSRWLLPLLRHRLEWMEGLVNQGQFAQVEAMADELSAIQGYMNTRSEVSDYRKVMDFIAKLAASSDVARQRLSMLLEPRYDEQSRAADEWRNRKQPHLYAYHEMAKLTLTARGGDLSKAAKLLVGQIDSLVWAFPQARRATNRLSKSSDPTQGTLTHRPSSTGKNLGATAANEPIRTAPWSMVVVLIVATFGLLWLLLKRREKRNQQKRK